MIHNNSSNDHRHHRSRDGLVRVSTIDEDTTNAIIVNNDTISSANEIIVSSTTSSNISSNTNEPIDTNDWGYHHFYHRCGPCSQQRIICTLLLIYSIILTTIFIRTITTTPTPATSESSNDANSIYFSKLFNSTLPHYKSLPPFDTTTLQRIAFGSCSSQNMPQPYWDTILTYYNPDLFLLMGDNVYGDCTDDNNTGNNIQCSELYDAYRSLMNHPSFSSAVANISLLATLDDHDYGRSDCDSTNPYKEIAQEYFVEFFRIDNQNQNNQLPLGYTTTSQSSVNDNDDTIKDGVYRAGIWGTDEKDRVQYILLDTRYMRSPFLSSGDKHSPYTPYNDSTYDNDDSNVPRMLSERQWTWLSEQFQEKSARIRILVSSIQVLNDHTGFESWRHIPRERNRLYQLIYNTTIHDQSQTIILSGDRHVGGFYEYQYMPPTTNTINNQSVLIIEVTSSSLTHSIPYGTYNESCTSAYDCDEYDPNRMGDFVRENMFGTIDIEFVTTISTNTTITTNWHYDDRIVPMVQPIIIQKKMIRQRRQEHHNNNIGPNPVMLEKFYNLEHILFWLDSRRNGGFCILC